MEHAHALHRPYFSTTYLMLPWLLDYLAGIGTEPALAGVAKITLRAALAAMASFLVAVLLGPWLIGWLRTRFREPIVSDSDAVRRLHEHKAATPTMGGLFIVAGLVGATCLLADLGSLLVQAALVLVVGLGLIGAADDLVKLRGRRNGLSVRGKLAAQLVVATLAAVLVWEHHRNLPDGLSLALPLLGQVGNLGIAFIPLAVLVIVGSSNAVNLTDGLDGLAGGCLIFTTAAMTAVTYAAGHAEIAQYLAIPRIPGAGELTIPAAALVGGVLGFLWFNCHPAQVFMGDTGALPLGGLLGLLALAARQEWLLVVAGGVFVAEAGSVILQVCSYKLRRKRIFRCAPLHHHFQLLGWPEGKIVVRFWIAAALCALAGLAAIKLNIEEGTSPERAQFAQPEVAPSVFQPVRHHAIYLPSGEVGRGSGRVGRAMCPGCYLDTTGECPPRAYEPDPPAAREGEALPAVAAVPREGPHR